jgi:AcrR family transcriptional regulator
MLASRDPAEVSIQEITEAADVGFGSFYNHFDSDAELFDAALTQAMEELGQLLDDVTRDTDDPAQVFATAVRITARLPRTHPQLAKIMLRTGLPYLTTEQGLTPRALRDLRKAKARRTVRDRRPARRPGLHRRRAARRPAAGQHASRAVTRRPRRRRAGRQPAPHVRRAP